MNIYLISNIHAIVNKHNKFPSFIHGETSRNHSERVNEYNPKEKNYYPVSYYYGVKRKSGEAYSDRKLKRDARDELTEKNESFVIQNYPDTKKVLLLGQNYFHKNIIQQFCDYDSCILFKPSEIFNTFLEDINQKNNRIESTKIFYPILQAQSRFNNGGKRCSGIITLPVDPLTYNNGIEFHLKEEEIIIQRFYFPKEAIQHFVYNGKKQLEFHTSPSLKKLEHYQKKYGREFFGHNRKVHDNLYKFDLQYFTHDQIRNNFNKNRLVEVF